MTPTPANASFHKPTKTVYGEIRACIIYTTMDRAFPYDAQLQMAEFLKGKSKPGMIAEYTIESAHYPSLSKPKELADTCLSYLKGL
jgi:hypothetical protein